MENDRLRRLRRLSAVPRWNGVYTIRSQNTAEHSFQALAIALWLAQRHVEMQGVSARLKLVEYVIAHDEEEAVFGDIPSPAKSILGDVLKAFEKKKGYAQPLNDDIRFISKCADCLEALMFCKEEKALGNNSLNYIYEDILSKFEYNWSMFKWNEHIYKKPMANHLVEEVWQIIHISNHPVLTELQ